MELTLKSITDEKAQWEAAGVVLPTYDIPKLRANTKDNVQWVHFGTGNIFRDFIAGHANKLLNEGKMNTGIVAVEGFDNEVIDLGYAPYDMLTLSVGLRCDGGVDLKVQAGIAEAIKASEDIKRLWEIAKMPSLQMVSYTITEKGYVVKGADGNATAFAQKDIDNGPEQPVSTMGMSAAMLYQRYLAGKAPVAFVSMDNCSGNGDKLKDAVLFIAQKWIEAGKAEAAFIDYLKDESKVCFPCTMIDKITPRPDTSVAKTLEDKGIKGMQPFKTSKNTFIAPFVNAEIPQYLVVEDKFPNGRPALQDAGVYMTDRATVEAAERMKVQSCLNPLHTGLAVTGCLLGFNKISEEMSDPDLKKLPYGLGKEGLEVVCDPGIIKPADFLKEVLEDRLPNPFLPDTPQRIACDTSQKVPIRFGQTLRSYVELGREAELEQVPFVLAAWLRYLSGYDDNLEQMELSPDPELESLSKRLEVYKPGTEISDLSVIEDLLKETRYFGLDVTKYAALTDKVKAYYKKMMSGKGAVREALREAVKSV
ncbi:MAG: mannitol dehydrogenase family protein [Lachnospiraceae bacterium]|nr:mannitol dehydrogenase family protein [Lachnospiraceae bacterium]